MPCSTVNANLRLKGRMIDSSNGVVQLHVDYRLATNTAMDKLIIADDDHPARDRIMTVQANIRRCEEAEHHRAEYRIILLTKQ